MAHHQHIREEKIVDYVLGQLSNQEHFKVNTHLAICSTCAIKRDYWEKHLIVEETPIPSHHLKHKVFTNINHRQSRFNKNRFAYFALSLCLVFIFTLGIFQLSKSDPMVTEEDAEQIIAQPEELLDHIHLNNQTVTRLDHLPLYISNDHIWSINQTSYHHNDLYELLSTTNRQINDQIIFIHKDHICKYNPKQKQLSCVQIPIHSQTNQFIPIHSKTFQLDD